MAENMVTLENVTLGMRSQRFCQKLALEGNPDGWQKLSFVISHGPVRCIKLPISRNNLL